MLVQFGAKMIGFIGTVLASMVLIFIMLEVLPGDPALVMLGPDATPDTLAALRSGDAAIAADTLRDHVAVQGEKFHQLMASLRTAAQ